jgi:hypothetical protein
MVCYKKVHAQVTFRYIRDEKVTTLDYIRDEEAKTMNIGLCDEKCMITVLNKVLFIFNNLA